MTNRNLAKSNSPRPFNKKDGNGPRRDYTYNARLEALNFTRAGWNKHSYTWPGEFPTFTLAPGVIEGEAGLVARCPKADKEILFVYGAAPADIKARLDDEILTLMGLQADIDDPMPVEAPIPFMGEPLPHQPLIVEGQEIGPEIEF